MNGVDISKKFVKNLLVSTLPGPVQSIITALEDVKDEEELAEKFNELKDLLKKIETTIPALAIQFEKILVNSVVYYLDTRLGDDTREIIRENIDILKIDEHQNCYIDDFFVEEDMIIVNLVDEVEKEDCNECCTSFILRALEGSDIRIKGIGYL